MRGTVATFPVTQRGCGKAKAGGELFLRHTHTLAQRLHIHWAGPVNPRLRKVTLRVGNSFLQAERKTHFPRFPLANSVPYNRRKPLRKGTACFLS